MVRFVIIGIVIAVAFTLYALVDAAMTDGARARGVSKPVWVVLVVVLPVIGGLLWFVIGKGTASSPAVSAPDDDPRFTGTQMTKEDLDTHMQDLEARLRELDDETFPGETRGPAVPDPESGSDASAGVPPVPGAGAGAGADEPVGGTGDDDTRSPDGTTEGLDGTEPGKRADGDAATQ